MLSASRYSYSYSYSYIIQQVHENQFDIFYTIFQGCNVGTSLARIGCFD